MAFAASKTIATNRGWTEPDAFGERLAASWMAETRTMITKTA